MSMPPLPRTFLYRVQLFFFHILRLIVLLLHHIIPSPKPLPPKATPSAVLPPHVALSGPLSQDPSSLSQLISSLFHHGATHLTLHDPWKSIIPPITPSVTVRIISKSGVTIRGTGERTLTLVAPRAGRSVLVNAARSLAQADAKIDRVEDVAQWIDDRGKGLVSEPDVLVVFGCEERGKVLYGFPVWELRLTQIRFVAGNIASVPETEIRGLICGAAAAPKRFGR